MEAVEVALFLWDGLLHAWHCTRGSNRTVAVAFSCLAHEVKSQHMLAFKSRHLDAHRI